MGCSSSAAEAPRLPAEKPTLKSSRSRAFTDLSGEGEAGDALTTIRGHVYRLLDTKWPELKNSSMLETWRDRDRMMREVGPPMVLLHWETIRKLGRIPRSHEGLGIGMEDAAKIAEEHGKRFFIEMFSHRWCSRQAPDDELNSKATVMVEWARYRWHCGLATFFWIDYTCIDQDYIAPGVCMLPLYVSSCNNIVCYDTPEYEPRAWTRVERTLFAAFVAPNTEYVGPDFRFDEEARQRIVVELNELKPISEERVALVDPEDGDLSYVADGGIINKLNKLCLTHWSKCWKDGLMSIVEERGKLRGVRGLRFGETEVRLRRFSTPASPVKSPTQDVRFPRRQSRQSALEDESVSTNDVTRQGTLRTDVTSDFELLQKGSSAGTAAAESDAVNITLTISGSGEEGSDRVLQPQIAIPLTPEKLMPQEAEEADGADEILEVDNRQRAPWSCLACREELARPSKPWLGCM